MPRRPTRPRALLTAVSVGLAGLAFPGPVTAQEPGTLSLSPSASRIIAGDALILSGVLDGPDGCAGGRPVRLQSRSVTATEWEPLGETSTADDGAYASSFVVERSATFRAVAPATETCAEVLSAESGVVVKARVDTVAPARARAGTCPTVTVTVTPDKTGQTVRLQRLRRWGWRTLESLELSAGSTVAATPCLRWADLGQVTLRARWPAQDQDNATSSSEPVTLRVVKARWMRRIDRLTAGVAASVSVREEGKYLYRRRDGDARIPASNQKLLLSMAILEALGPEYRFPTRVLGPAPESGVVRGDLWIVGRGDPTVGPGTMRALSRTLARSGIRRVRGRIRGSTSYFARDWWAPGWRSYFPGYYVALPTALTFRGNRTPKGRAVTDPERRAAADLTRRLEARGVPVSGRPGAGRHPGGLTELASFTSVPLPGILRATNLWSSNFSAEVLGKRLGASRGGVPGSITKGAAAIDGWAEGEGVWLSAYDSSGLSYANRATAAGLARLLEVAEGRPWGPALFGALPAAGQGTLQGRLDGVKVRAKTGTLTRVSALSGYVFLERRGTWGEFSILIEGTSKSAAVRIEDAVVRILANRGT